VRKVQGFSRFNPLLGTKKGEVASQSRRRKKYAIHLHRCKGGKAKSKPESNGTRAAAIFQLSRALAEGVGEIQNVGLAVNLF
jgi:hypothetical protein